MLLPCLTLSRRTNQANFANFGKIFSSVLLFIAAVKQVIEKPATVLMNFDGIASIPMTLFISGLSASVSNSFRVTNLKYEFSYQEDYPCIKFDNISK